MDISILQAPCMHVLLPFQITFNIRNIAGSPVVCLHWSNEKPSFSCSNFLLPWSANLLIFILSHAVYRWRSIGWMMPKSPSMLESILDERCYCWYRNRWFVYMYMYCFTQILNSLYSTLVCYIPLCCKLCVRSNA